MTPRVRLVCVVAALALFCAHDAGARPGGGNSYSGGSSRGGGGGSSGGGGGSGGGWGSSSSRSSSSSFGSSTTYVGGGGSNSFSNGLVGVLIIFFVGAGLVLPFLQGLAQVRADRAQQTDIQVPSQPRAPRRDARFRVLQVVRDHDPDFSLVLFEDFAYALYA
jgi:hypothetical protein